MDQRMDRWGERQTDQRIDRHTSRQTARETNRRAEGYPVDSSVGKYLMSTVMRSLLWLQIYWMNSE